MLNFYHEQEIKARGEEDLSGISHAETQRSEERQGIREIRKLIVILKRKKIEADTRLANYAPLFAFFKIFASLRDEIPNYVIQPSRGCGLRLCASPGLVFHVFLWPFLVQKRRSAAIGSLHLQNLSRNRL